MTKKKCPWCFGEGEDYEICSSCGGSGEDPTYDPYDLLYGDAAGGSAPSCSRCLGDGRITFTCEKCKGSGYVDVE